MKKRDSRPKKMTAKRSTREQDPSLRSSREKRKLGKSHFKREELTRKT
jgi:hypothetical protein